jgi:hypothetical protein
VDEFGNLSHSICVDCGLHIVRDVYFNQATVSRICQNREEILQRVKNCEPLDGCRTLKEDSPTRKLDECVLKYIKELRDKDANVVITGRMLQAFAREAGRELYTSTHHLQEFTASEGWLRGFKRRHAALLHCEAKSYKSPVRSCTKRAKHSHEDGQDGDSMTGENTQQDTTFDMDSNLGRLLHNNDDASDVFSCCSEGSNASSRILLDEASNDSSSTAGTNHDKSGIEREPSVSDAASKERQSPASLAPPQEVSQPAVTAESAKTTKSPQMNVKAAQLAAKSPVPVQAMPSAVSFSFTKPSLTVASKPSFSLKQPASDSRVNGDFLSSTSAPTLQGRTNDAYHAMSPLPTSAHPTYLSERDQIAMRAHVAAQAQDMAMCFHSSNNRGPYSEPYAYALPNSSPQRFQGYNQYTTYYNGCHFDVGNPMYNPHYQQLQLQQQQQPLQYPNAGLMHTNDPFTLPFDPALAHWGPYYQHIGTHVYDTNGYSGYNNGSYNETLGKSAPKRKRYVVGKSKTSN